MGVAEEGMEVQEEAIVASHYGNYVEAQDIRAQGCFLLYVLSISFLAISSSIIILTSILLH